MKNGNHLPAGSLHENRFTTIQLPEESIKDQLADLPGSTSIELATEVKDLRAAVLADHGLTSLRVRKNHSEFSDQQKSAYKSAIEKIVSEGAYSSLVLVHTDMSHNMHGSMGTTGLLRFLAWHRSYLMQFENLLIAADRDLRPTATDRIYLPFWHWNDDFPDWLGS